MVRLTTTLFVGLLHYILVGGQSVTPPAPVCTSPPESLPNPLAADAYPNIGTGTANGTIAVIPIPYATARKIVPAQFPILKNAYGQRFPELLKKNLYPMFIAMVLDHDIQINGKQVAPDFTRASLIFPFVDRLNNGHTPFRYGGPILFSTNPAIIATQPGFRNTYFGTFDPACEAYAADPGSKKSDGFTYVKAWLGDGEVKGERPSFDTKFRVSEEKYGFDVFSNFTNQVIFASLANGSVTPLCDQFIGIYNTTLTTGVNAPVPVVGDVTVRAPLLPPAFGNKQTFKGVYGFRFDGAWIDRPDVLCETLAG